MTEYKNYFNEYLVEYEDENGKKQKAILSSKNKEQAYITAQMIYHKIISISAIGNEKDLSKDPLKEDIILNKEEGLESGIYNPMKLYIAGGLTDSGKYVEKKISARSEEAARMIAKMRYPELKDIQVVEAEDFESMS
jgi:type II secretory pathway component PulF